MKYLNAFAPILAALVIAAAGIAGVFDETTMIMLTVIIVCCMPNGRGTCIDPRRA